VDRTVPFTAEANPPDRIVGDRAHPAMLIREPREGPRKPATDPKRASSRSEKFAGKQREIG
jgi:hypothetical protein